MIKEKRRKIGLTALELGRLNLQNKFLKMKSLEEHPRNLLFKYCCSSSNIIHKEVIVYYKKGSGVSYNKKGQLLNLDNFYKKFLLIDDNYDDTSFLRCKEPEKCIFRFANITEIFGLTLNILNNGK